MAYLSESSKAIISKKKLDIINGSIRTLEDYVSSLCELRPDIYEVKETSWEQRIKQIKSTLEQDSYFLFIGTFSSGKSTFINKLLGIDILPTAKIPCTAIVTEVRFVEGGRKDGKIVYLDGSEDIVMQDDLRDVITGKKTIENGSVHHLELCLDISQLGENKDSLRTLIDKVVLVDCPGFGSPYKFPEDVLYEYIDKASFTFYMMPADDFGGMEEISRVSSLRKKTASLIPIVSKSDIISSDEQKECIEDSFVKTLAGKFEMDLPLFVSSYKYDEYQQMIRTKRDAIALGQISDKEQDEINKLWLQSGIANVFSQIARKAKDSELNEKKVASILFDYNEIVDELHKASITEINYWRRELDNLGYNIEKNTFNLIENNNRAINTYIDEQAKTVGQELKSNIVVGLAGIKPDSTDKEGDVKRIFNNEFINIQEKYYPIWQRRFKDYYDGLKVSKGIDDGNFSIPNINDFPLPGSHILMGVLDGIKVTGIKAIGSAAVGGTLLVSKAAIAGMAIIGGPLATLAGIVGVAAIAYAGVSSFPDIIDGINHRKEKNEKQAERAISDLIDNDAKLNFEEVIKQCLIKYKEELTSAFITSKNSKQVEFSTHYTKSIEIKETLEKIQGDLNLQVGK